MLNFNPPAYSLKLTLIPP